MTKLFKVSKFLLRLFVLSLFIFFALKLFYELNHPQSQIDPYFIFQTSLFFDILNSGTPLVFFIATLLFVIGLVKYIIFKLSKKEDPQKKSEIKKTIVYSGVTMCLALAFEIFLAFGAATLDKPVIYFYPQQKQDVKVQLNYQRKIIAGLLWI